MLHRIKWHEEQEEDDDDDAAEDKPDKPDKAATGSKWTRCVEVWKVRVGFDTTFCIFVFSLSVCSFVFFCQPIPPHPTPFFLCIFLFH
jgi:hypothetical protein